MNSTHEERIGLIPAAGKGVRLQLPFPKELYPVNINGKFKPVSQFVVENLTSAGIHHIVFVINSTKHQLIDYFGDGHKFNCRISYVVQDSRGIENHSTSPGLAHALDSAFHLIENKTVFFGMADTIIEPVDIFTQAYKNLPQDAEVVLGVFPTNEPHKFGAVDFTPDGYVNRIEDKNRDTKLTEMWGFMIWRSKFTQYLHKRVLGGISDFGTIMNDAIKQEQMQFHSHRVTGGKYLDLGTYEDITKLKVRWNGS